MSRNKNQFTPIGGFLVLLSAVGVVWIVWRATRDVAVEDTLLRIQRTGVVRIGYANEAPYGYLDSSTGKITGEAPEIASLILRKLGAEEIEPVVTEFGSLIPGLKADRFDVIAAGMYITPERNREIDFSNPTYAIGEAFLVRTGNPKSLHRFEDVAAKPDVKLGVMGGSVEHGYAQELGVPDDRIVIFPEYPSALAGLRTNRVDAVAVTVLTASDLLQKFGSGEIEMAEPFVDPIIDGESVRGYGAFGFRPEDDELRKAFNEQLAEFLGSEEHLELVRPFGFSEKTLPGDVSAEELAGAM